jgi:hypothetical protein
MCKWLNSYRTLLNTWQHWEERATLDVKMGALERLQRAAKVNDSGDMKTPTVAATSSASSSVAANAAAAVFTSASATSEKPSSQRDDPISGESIGSTGIAMSSDALARAQAYETARAMRRNKVHFVVR